MKPKKPKKKKQNLKSKIKNFFRIPEEVFEEEESPNFKREKLFTFTRTNIFIGLALFLLIINLIIFTNLNFLYLRQILGFLFLISVPGLILMLCFKIRNIGFWEYLVYTVGLSISFIMFAGLIVNWTLPWLEITNTPLSLYPILICFDIFLIVLGIVAYKRNKDFKPKPFTVPKLDRLNNIMFTIPLVFPVLSILGAFLLNNHGPNILTMIMLGGIAVYVLLLTIFRKKLDKNIWPWALYWMGLALVLMGSMRGWFISAPDASLEYGISKHFLNQGIYKYWSLPGNYSAMLSVSILPGIISLFSDFNLFLVFKLFYPLMFAVLFVCIFLISKKVLSAKYSFLATLFFLFQPTIINWIRFPPRQEIAFLFLGLIFLSFLNSKISFKKNSLLLLLFGFSLTVSHYSTTAIFLFCLILVPLSKLIMKRVDKRFDVKIFSIIFIILLILFAFFWYSQITNTSDSFISFGKDSLYNLGKIFNKEVYSAGNSPLEQISLFRPDNYNPVKDLQEYVSLSNKESDTNTIHNSYLTSGSKKAVLNQNLLEISLKLRSVLILTSKLILIFGLFFFFIPFKKNSKRKEKIYLIASALFLVFCAIILFPFASTRYNLDRLYLQVLILLAPLSLWGWVNILKTKKNYFALAYSLFLILFLIVSIWFFGSIHGGNNLSLTLENKGNEYDILYSSVLEINSASWLLNVGGSKTVVADNYGKFKIYQSGNLYEYRLKTDVLPIKIERQDYVYSSNSNKIREITFKYYGRGLLTYNFPTEFLQDNKNKIYNNGGSEIFK